MILVAVILLLTSLCYLRRQTLSAWILNSSFHVRTATSMTKPLPLSILAVPAIVVGVALLGVARYSMRPHQHPNSCCIPNGTTDIRGTIRRVQSSFSSSCAELRILSATPSQKSCSIHSAISVGLAFLSGRSTIRNSWAGMNKEVRKILC